MDALKRLYIMIDPAYATRPRGENCNFTLNIGFNTQLTMHSNKNAIKYVKKAGTDHQVGRNFNVVDARDIRWQNLVVSSIGVSSVMKIGSPAIFFGDVFNVSFARMWAQATLPRMEKKRKRKLLKAFLFNLFFLTYLCIYLYTCVYTETNTLLVHRHSNLT